MLLGLTRGARQRCPNCGEGRLFRRYLKVEPLCARCGHDNLQYPSDDGPPYFTILIVGHLYVAPLIVLHVIWTWPIWVTLPLLSGGAVTLCLVLLPIVKGAVIGVLWAVGKPPDA
jgi:uncharacterized protein (DUF983 family)